MNGYTPDQIKALRKSRGETQEEFAASIGVTVRTVSRWETGDVEPSKLARRLLQAESLVPTTD